ncbi:MAG: bifunctional (p)ppGpp synthetase/guanosine-3',5'-bis(diphosphate) 3'-pyrophosphohydrolase [Caldilineae bacterium]|nr:MAG: bifunctional (p)ppGpp synthetase/guanosine-3',5'-bis(diphosphate) 3'-pyrophosphohydrolase [Caldilineae bacterium]
MTHIWSADSYAQAWRFAAQAHQGQTVTGSDLPYIVHVAGVAAEVMTALARGADVAEPDLAVQCALLHDVIEDTPVTHQELAQRFGQAVADGVLALSKNPNLPSRSAQMADSLARIRLQPREIWLVKLADRITNLQPPPVHWSAQKIAAYREEAQAILETLGAADAYLAQRLAQKIAAYPDDAI